MKTCTTPEELIAMTFSKQPKMYQNKRYFSQNFLLEIIAAFAWKG
jgi:hypothetical protein